MASWFSSPTPAQQLDASRNELAAQRGKMERQRGDLRAQVERKLTLGNNALDKGNESEADAMYREVAELEMQQRQLDAAIIQLRRSETQLILSETSVASARAFDMSSRALAQADARMPGQSVTSAAMRTQRANHSMAAKRDIINNAYASAQEDADDDDALGLESSGPVASRVQELRESRLRQRMPTTGPLGRSSSAAAAAAAAGPTSVADLPQVRPLNR